MRVSRCACGECSVEVEDDRVRSGLCNCDACRRRTGAPFSWSVYFPNHQVRTVEGPFSIRLVESGEFAPHSRHFCSRCGSTLYWNAGALTGFTGGCFNDPTLIAPRRVARYSQRMPWAAIPTSCEIDA
jgi:hypothetical protein